MKRFNYLAPSHEYRAAKLFDSLRGVDFTMRTQAAFLLFSAAALVSSGLAFWQTTQVRGAQLQLAVARARFTQAERRLHGIAPITREIESLQATATRVAEVRSRTSARLQMVADLGDALSERVWLVSLHENDEGTLLIRGRAQNLADLGRVMDGLRAQRALDAPRIEKIHALPSSDRRVVEFDVAMREKM